MYYQILVDIVVLFHLAFVLFTLVGGLLVIRWKKAVWVHVPVVIWAALIEFSGWICPLTPLENWLREKAGMTVYTSGFVERYIIPVIYPDGLTRRRQVLLGLLVLVVNLGIYGWVLRRAIKANCGRDY